MAAYVDMHIGEDSITVSFDVGTPAIMAIGEKMNELCPEAYMNG